MEPMDMHYRAILSVDVLKSIAVASVFIVLPLVYSLSSCRHDHSLDEYTSVRCTPISSTNFARSKYLGGHADLVAGVVTVKTTEHWKALMTYRTILGNVMVSHQLPEQSKILKKGTHTYTHTKQNNVMML